MIDRLVKETGGSEAGNSVFTGLVAPRAVDALSMASDPVFFGGAVEKLFWRYEGWQIPSDQPREFEGDESPPQPTDDTLTRALAVGSTDAPYP